MKFGVHHGKDLWVLSIFTTVSIIISLIIPTWTLFVAPTGIKLVMAIVLIAIILFYIYMISVFPVSYSICKNKLLICKKFGTVEWEIPHASTAKVVSGKFKNSYRIKANGGFFAFSGLYKTSSGDTINVYSGTLATGVLISTPKNELYFVSPKDPSVFIRELGKHI
jgi:hypothetical protein